MVVRVINMPGANVKAYVMLPLRVTVFGFFFTLMYPMFLSAAFLRAIYLRIAVGKPSQVLKYGTYPPPKKDADGRLKNANHHAATHYPCQQLYNQPLDEAKLTKVLYELAAEDGIAEDEIQVKFMDEKPNDWPETGSYDVTSALLTSFPKGHSYINKLFGPPFGECTWKKLKLVYWVYNNDPGKPTVVMHGGSADGWDGSSNFNFNKELMRRYAGLPPKNVFAYPEISAEAAAKLDQPSFTYFLAKLPVNVFKNVVGAVWNMTRSAYWAGGNGAFVPRIVAMNFSVEESAELAASAKKLGVSPFACFTYAAVKACKEVLGQAPTNICNQASLQTRCFPVAGQGKERDFVGDWLIGAMSQIPDGEEFTLDMAMAKYKEMMTDLDTCGPITQAAFQAKAYGLVNSGAASFEPLPTFNDNLHIFDRSLFMNNYGTRQMPKESPFDTWNWNAPMWLGVNTINVNGKTTTLVGSCMWGMDLVEDLRNHMEATLRGIMKGSKA